MIIVFTYAFRDMPNVTLVDQVPVMEIMDHFLVTCFRISHISRMF
jgi:hypothetical protein